MLSNDHLNLHNNTDKPCSECIAIRSFLLIVITIIAKLSESRQKQSVLIQAFHMNLHTEQLNSLRRCVYINRLEK